MIPGWRYAPVPRPGHMGGSPSSNREPYPACLLPSTFHIPFLIIWYILSRVFSYIYKGEHEKVNQCHFVSVGEFLKDSILYFLMFETVYISSQNGTFLLLKIWKRKPLPPCKALVTSLFYSHLKEDPHQMCDFLSLAPDQYEHFSISTGFFSKQHKHFMKSPCYETTTQHFNLHHHPKVPTVPQRMFKRNT